MGEWLLSLWAEIHSPRRGLIKLALMGFEPRER